MDARVSDFISLATEVDREVIDVKDLVIQVSHGFAALVSGSLWEQMN